MAQVAVNFTTPVGRIVWGNLYEGKTIDYDGNPLKYKTGTNAGQPRKDFSFGLAIPKGTEQHWASTEWGAKIWAAGHAAHPVAAQRPDFSWKIVDGDSTIPNKKNNRPCDQEGNPGHWVLRFSGSLEPRLFTLIGQPPGKPAPIMEKGAITAGFFVQVAGNVSGNEGQSPGVYLNHNMVCLIAYGTPIVSGPDPESAGFGATQLPAGATLTPTAAFVPPVTAATAPAPGPATPPPPVAVAPHATIRQAAPPPPAAAAPPAPAAPVRHMTAKATATYDAYIASGWTDAQLVQHGMMEPF